MTCDAHCEWSRCLLGHVRGGRRGGGGKTSAQNEQAIRVEVGAGICQNQVPAPLPKKEKSAKCQRTGEGGLKVELPLLGGVPL